MKHYYPFLFIPNIGGTKKTQTSFYTAGIKFFGSKCQAMLWEFPAKLKNKEICRRADGGKTKKENKGENKEKKGRKRYSCNLAFSAAELRGHLLPVSRGCWSETRRLVNGSCPPGSASFFPSCSPDIVSFNLILRCLFTGIFLGGCSVLSLLNQHICLSPNLRSFPLLSLQVFFSSP